MRTAVLCSLVVFAAYIGTTVAAKHVIQLTDANFKSKVLDSDELWYIKFYAPWCGHCKSMAGDWEKAAANLKGMVNIAEVDCTVHTAVASQFGIRGYPTIKVFPAGKAAKKNPRDYQGARTAKAIVNAAVADMPSAVKSVSDKNIDEFLSTNPEKGKVLLFTSKSKTSSLYKAMSNRLKAGLDFAELRASASGAIERFGVETFPTLMLVAGDEQVVYEGELKIEPLVAWARPFAGDAVDDAAAAGGDGDDDSASNKWSAGPSGKTAYKPPSKGPVVVNELTGAPDGPGSAAEMCEDASGMCVFSLFYIEGEEMCTKENPTVEEKQAARNALLDSDHAETLTALATKFKKDPLNFSWVDAKKQDAFASAFGVEAYPAVVVYKSGKRPRFHKFEGDFDSDSVAAVLDRALGGDLAFTKTDGLPDLTPPEGC